jgi:hypothetical protein
MRIREAFWTVMAASAFAAGVGGAAPARAADPPQAAAPAGSCVRGRDLMTPEERDAHRAKMQAATPEEQAKLRAEMHAEMVKRAAAKKQTLCAKSPGGGMGPGAGRGPGGPPAAP